MRISDTVGLSGWIFADLLLALVVIFVAISAPELASAARPSTSPPSSQPSAIATASPSPTPLPPPQDAVLLRAVCKRVHVDNQSSPLFDGQVIEALAQGLADLRALPVSLKLVYAYGVWPTDDGTATKVLAKKVTDALRSEQLRSRLPNLLGDGDQILTHNFRAIPGGDDRPGDVYLELYLAAAAETKVPTSTLICPH